MSRLIDADALKEYFSYSARLCEDIDKFPTIEERKTETPCDLCRHNPPSSGDGKPCSYCPAEQI